VPDGSTVLLVHEFLRLPSALKKVTYDPSTSSEPVCYSRNPDVLVVNGARPLPHPRRSPRRGGVPSPANWPWPPPGRPRLQMAFEVSSRAAFDIPSIRDPGTGAAINALAGRSRGPGLVRLPDGGRALQSAAWRGLVTRVSCAVERCPTCDIRRDRGEQLRGGHFSMGAWRRRGRRRTRSCTWLGCSAAALKAPEMKPEARQAGAVFSSRNLAAPSIG